MMPSRPTDAELFDSLGLICEIAMFVLLIFAGHGFARGWQGWAIGVFLAVVAIGLWVQWMSPNSIRYIEGPKRFAVQVMIIVTAALYAVAGGLLWWALGFAVISIAVFAAQRNVST